ncbi:LysR family transcriptional regulator [Ornithinicoccus halotolerans]|uniref:LysR family transcriptional regulator n=1 Tax=Ornithinicoccus halotolerans TaxID=1748220 RepID=UPI00129683F6|nr:LysR family transcriptional regulator [Ornithinicoccus halotolerans]
MDVRHLELLRELADRGSVTAVAAATHRSPSAVSQQLKTAQRQLGVPLVQPAGRGLRLTDAGALLAEGGREVARTVEAVQARWDDFRGQPAGTVTVAALPSAAAVLLPGVLRELEGRPIELACTDVDLAESDYADLVTDHDLVIAHSLSRAAPAGTDGLATVELLREPLDIAMRHDHVLTARSTVRAEDLVDVEWYGVPLGYPFDTVRLAVEAVTGRPVRVVQRLRDNRLIEALVGDSDRVAVLPRYSTPAGAGVSLRELSGIPTARYVFAVMRPDRAQRLVVRHVLQTIRGVAAAIRA